MIELGRKTVHRCPNCKAEGKPKCVESFIIRQRTEWLLNESKNMLPSEERKMIQDKIKYAFEDMYIQ